MTINKSQIVHFVDRLLQDKGVEDLEQEVLEQMKEDLLARIEDRIDAMIMDKLPDDKIADFERLLDANDEDAIQNYIKSNIPNLEQEIALVLIDFKNIYLG